MSINMLLSKILCAFIAFAGGITIAGGLFALITTLKIITRIADKTHTKQFIKTYETAIFLGGSIWCFYFISPFSYWLGPIFLSLFGLFAGLFVGCLAVSLAESLNVSSILYRRINLHLGFSFIILSIALGKLVGALIYFATFV